MPSDVIRNLPTPDEMYADRLGKPISKAGLPTPLARKARAKTKKAKDDAFRDAVWARDKGRSRATGRKVVRSGTTDWSLLGEVDHAYLRSTDPDRIYDVSNGILLSKEENRLRKVACAQAPEFRRFNYSGPDDRGEPQTFVWRNADGTVVRRTVGWLRHRRRGW